jgi:hypothetical protein
VSSTGKEMSMSDEQSGGRRRFAAEQKVAILKEHLVEKVQVFSGPNETAWRYQNAVLGREP